MVIKEQQKSGGSTQRHGANSEHGMGTVANEELQLTPPLPQEENPTAYLMERVVESENLKKACKRVKANKGSPGIDGMTTQSLEEWLRKHEATLRRALLEGTYVPQPVKGVQIPKPGGGKRQLGIPTVVDRLIQQAILQVLDPILDPTFSNYSYGFRINRNAHQAVQQAAEYVAEGRYIVVDIDLEKFFDRVNHNVLMGKLAKRIKDGRILKIIRCYLQAGMMSEGVCIQREEGTPQGGPLSPLLANFLLDDLDKELEKRGHCFCRYADDCNIYVCTIEAGNRVMESITRFLETKLKLKVNREKSCVAPITQRKFLGYRIYGAGKVAIAPQSIQRFKEKIREKTSRWSACAMEEIIKCVNVLTVGWTNYFQLIDEKAKLTELDGWIRRRLRAIKLKQLKKPRTIAEFLQEQGVTPKTSWATARSGKGLWRLSRSSGVHRGMRNKWLENLGHQSMVKLWEQLTGNLEETAVYGTVRTVV
jgi:RNA-directed DNA polymerase